MTYLPLDHDNHPIPALRLKRAGGAHAIASSGASARNATAFGAGTRVVSVYATAPVYLRFGGADAAAGSDGHYFPAGIYYDFALGGGGKTGHFTHLAVLAAAGDATVYVSEKE